MITIAFEEWELEDAKGNLHRISNHMVLAHLKYISDREQKAIYDAINSIKLAHGSVNGFLKHLAKVLI